LRPNWPKGWRRKGAALKGLRNLGPVIENCIAKLLDGAREAYEQADRLVAEGADDSRQRPYVPDRASADVENELGNVAFRNGKFVDATAHYEEAWILFHDPVYLSNLSAAYSEEGDYSTGIDKATLAIAEERNANADAKVIAKFIVSVEE
jgi:tetratricopeptide (TPR) repeat protein